MKKILRRKALSKNEEDVIDSKIAVDKGKIVDFSVNLSCSIDGKMYSIARFDLEHGFLHFHKNYSEKRTIVKLDDVLDGKKIEEFRILMEQNWRKWKKLFEKNHT